LYRRDYGRILALVGAIAGLELPRRREMAFVASPKHSFKKKERRLFGSASYEVE
jgi:hypothetical protein